MNKKSILALFLACIVSTSTIVSCGSSPEDKSKNNMKQTGEELKEGVKNLPEDIKYTAIKFKDDVSNAGYKLKEGTDAKNNYFTGNETDYMLNNDYVRVYEYDSYDNLEKDIKTISEDGTTINNKKIDFKYKPYYYKKGNSLILYEGNDPKYIDYLNNSYENVMLP